MSSPDPRSAAKLFVVDGVEPLVEAGLRGLGEKVDSTLVWPYIRLMIVVIGLIVASGLTGPQSLQDTIAFSVLAAVITGVFILLPALVRRLGEQPEGRALIRPDTPDFSSRAISSEKLVIGRAGRSGLDVDDRLRPRLRQDLAVLLQVRHGLQLDRIDHAEAIEDLIGSTAWEVIRVDRPARPMWSGLKPEAINAVLFGCLAVLDDTEAES